MYMYMFRAAAGNMSKLAHTVFSLLLCVCAEGNGCREKSVLGLVSSATVEYSAKSRPHM